MKSEYPVIQQAALRVMYDVCVEECVRTAVKEQNGLEALLKMLTDEELKDLHEGLSGLQMYSTLMCVATFYRRFNT